MERWLPSLRGELGLQVQGDQPTLVLEGVYDPPAGPLGEVVDAAVMHRIATATAQRFLDDVIDQLAPGSRPTGHST